jgi:CRISPR/Cas system CMR-associated protein Cmr5 small subunit
MLYIRRLEIEDDKHGDRQLLYSDYHTEAKKGLSKAMAFVMQKEGSISFLEYLKKDFEALGKGFAELDEMLIGKKDNTPKLPVDNNLEYDKQIKNIRKNIEKSQLPRIKMRGL